MNHAIFYDHKNLKHYLHTSMNHNHKKSKKCIQIVEEKVD